MVWGTIIAWYLYLAGLSAGAFITSFIVEKLFPKAQKLITTAHIISLVAIGIGLIVLIFDAPGSHSNPASLFFLLGNLKTSVMSWGVVILAISALIMFLFVLHDLMRSKKNGFVQFMDSARTILYIIGLVFAVGLGAYTGILIGVIKTVPLWNNALLPILFLVSAFSAGSAAVAWAGSFVTKEETRPFLHYHHRIHIVALSVEVLLIVLMFYFVASSTVEGSMSVATLMKGELAIPFWFMIIGGLLIPIIIEAGEVIYSRSHNYDKPNIPLTIFTETLVLIGGFLLRYLILHAAVPIDFLGFL